jgi:quercetin dioxygenase-like cupin family protein
MPGTSIVAAWFAILAGAAYAQSADPVTAAPEIHRVVVDNSYVRVLETRFAAGHPVASHVHPARVVVVLSPSRARIKTRDGKIEIADHKTGDVFWSDPIEHSQEAITGVVHEIETELKQPVPPRPAHTARDVPDLFPQLARVIFENDRVRVIDIRGEPGQSFPFHFHPARVLVSLGSGRSTVTNPNEKPHLTDYRPGNTSWAEPIEHFDAVLLGVFHNISIEIKSR